MPMVWYIPPLSPVVDALTETGHDGEDIGNLFGAIEAMRIPIEYLAELFTAGDINPVNEVLRKLGAMRAHMRRINLGEPPDEAIPASVGMSASEIEAMYHLLAIAKYDDRYVVPTAHAEAAAALSDELPGCSVDWTEQPGDNASPVGDRAPVPVTIESYHLTKKRMEAEKYTDLAGPR